MKRDPVQSLADQTLRRRKLIEAGLVLPCLGALALIPPAATIFAIEGRILGIPVVVAYVFAVWAALIIGARWLARRLEPGEDTGAEG